MSNHRIDNAFIEACENGDLDVVKYLLTSQKLQEHQEHADIHANDDYGLKMACANGHLDVVKYLLTSPDLKEHADIHAEDDLGFRWACHSGHLDVVKYLLTSPELTEHADIHAWSDDGFQRACATGHLDVVKYLLTSPELNEHADIHAYYDCGFRDACANGHLDVADFIIHHKNFISDSLELCLKERGEEKVIDVISTLSEEQQQHLFENHIDDLFPLYLEHNKPLPDGLCKEKQEEIEIFI